MKVSHANERFRRLDLDVAVVYTSKVPPIHLYVYTSIHLYRRLYIYTSIHPYIYTSIHPYISTSLHLYISIAYCEIRDLLSSHTCSKVQRDFFPSSWPSRPFCSLSRPNTFAAVPPVDGTYRRCRRLGSSQFAVNGVSWAVAKRMLAATQPR